MSATSTPIHPQPCSNPDGCRGRVALLTGICLDCGARHIRPQPGPQEQFLASTADFTLYAGSAGSGKTFALLADAFRWAGVRGWNGVVFRRQAVDLKGDGGLFAKARALYSMPGLLTREGSPMDIRWPGGGTLEFRHLDRKNYLNYQGLEYAWIGFEELTHFDMKWVTYVMGRLRSATGVPTFVRATCNPDPDHPIRRWVDWYLVNGRPDPAKSGVIRHYALDTERGDLVWGDTREEAAERAGRPPEEVKTFTLVSAVTEDNKIGLALNPGYLASLAAQGRVMEQRLRYGDWDATEDTGGMLRRRRWGFVDEPLAPIVRRARAWDKAATKPWPGNTDPDYTIGVLMEWDLHGRFYVSDVVVCREEPTQVSKLQRETAIADGPRVTQIAKISGGDTGKSDFDLNVRPLLSAGGAEVVSISERGSKLVRVTPMANALARGMRGNVPAVDYEYDETHDRWEPRGFFNNASGWMDRLYDDGGDGPKTVGSIVLKQCDDFPGVRASDHDDFPDAAADAFAVLDVPVRRKGNAAQRMIKAWS